MDTMCGSRYAGVLYVVLIVVLHGDNVECQTNTNRLGAPPSYMIVAPKVVRADQVVQVYISIFQLRYPYLNIRSAIRRNGEELASTTELFTQASSRSTQLRMPENTEAGDYTLLVEGSVDKQMSQPIFSNETKLIFNPKRVSVFILTDQYDYRQKSTVDFRVIAVQPNLVPVRSGTIDIYVRDARGLAVKRWIGLNVNHGFYEDSFPTGYPANFGWWKIEVHGWGYTYHKTFQVKNFYYTRHENLIKIPPYFMDNEYAITGSVKSQLAFTTVPVRGNATIELALKSRDGRTDFEPITKTYSMIDDIFGFNIPISEVKEALGDDDIDGTEVTVKAKVKDWYSLETTTEHSFTRIFGHIPQIKFIGGTVRTFKPGQTVDIHIAVFGKNGGKIPSKFNRLMRIQTVVERRNAGSLNIEEVKVIGEDSIVRYSYVAGSDDLFIKVRAVYSMGGGSTVNELTAYRHYSASDHYVHLTTSTQQATVDTFLVFTVRSSTHVPELHYQVVAAGNIVVASTLYMPDRQKTFALAASRDMVPDARLVVWGLSHDGEVLSDSLSFHVDGTDFSNFKLRVNLGKDFSTSTIELNAFTYPGALTAFSAEMKEFIDDYGVRPFLSKYQVYEELSTYELFGNTSYKHTWHLDNFEKENIYYPAPSSAIDANRTFEFAGLVVVTDARLTRIAGAKICNITLGYLPCFDGGCYRVEEGCDSVRQCEDGADEMGCPDPTQFPVGLGVRFNNTSRRWHYLVESRKWAWKRYYTKPYGRIDFRINTPPRPVWWVFNGFSLDSERGLSFVTEEVPYDNTMFFTIMVELPSKAFRGEQLGVQVSVFNRWSQPLEAIVMLMGSADFRHIRIEDFGIVSSYNPRTSAGDIQTMLTMQPGETRQIHFPIIPMKIGKVSATVRGITVTNQFTITKSVNVLLDGVTNHYHSTLLVDLEASGSLQVPYMQIPVPERFIDPGNRKHLYVPGSANTQVGVVGDVVGPGFFSPYLTATNTLNMVFGQGEQYVYNFGTNMFWLKFLKTTNQLSTDTLERVLGSLNIELQQVYGYIQANGAMDLRRRGTPSDTWVTAVTLEVLAASIEREWEQLIFIDVEILSRMANWITTRQDPDTGAFWSEAGIYDLKLKGNLTDDTGRPLNISLTAIVTISLSRSFSSLTGDAQSKSANAANLAADYLARHLPQLTDPFEICIVAYALHIANHPLRSQAFRMMESIRIEDSYIYWAHEKIPPNRLEFVNAIPYQYPRDTPPAHQSAAVQATSYALLVYLRKNQLSDAQPIMKWLQTQRNHQGGFGGTQDSLVALQALIAYGERETNRDLHKVFFQGEATSDKDWFMNAVLNSSNFMTQKTSSVPNGWGAVKGTFQGTGLALYQTTTTVNVEYPEQVRQPQVHAFDLVIDNLVFKGRNASLMEMNICVRWTATHVSERSGAAVLDLDIPTGYYVRKDMLIANQRVGRIHSQRSRFVAQKVVMYFDYLDSEWSCFFFPAERWYPVANATIQHRITVYDTYAPEYFNTTLYTTYSLFHLHMCQVCGSFQCPYCLFYNTAPTLIYHQYNHLVLLLVIAISQLVISLHR